MRRSGLAGAMVLTFACAGGPVADTQVDHVNPLITLHEASLPIFGLYSPSRGGGRGRDGGEPPPVRTGADRAAETLGFERSDYVFDSSMEGGVDRALPAFVEYAAGLQAAGASARTTPLMVKTAKVSDDPELAKREIARQLDAGVSGIVFVTVESASELETGLAAMRFAVHGGTRPDAVGTAPAYWGLTEADYRAKADLWPPNPEGELISWVIVESLEGLDNLREIAAVPGIGVLFPGSGSLRRVFTSTNADGERVVDTEAWEQSIQEVLAACKEFDIRCGIPAGPDDIEMRMDQGFSVFVISWGENGFKTVDIGRAKSGR